SPYSNSSEERKKTSLKSGTESLIRKICGETMTEMMNLETPEEHAEAHNYVDLAKETARQQIAQGLLAAEDLALERNDSMTAVQQGDEPSFRRCIKWRKLQDPSRHYHLTKKRNFIHEARAMPLIKKATTDNRALIVTGSAHLFGKNGVVNLLKHDLGLLNKDLGTEYSIERK